MSDSVRAHRQQPTRLLHPWDFPGKSTGVGCHCLLRLASKGKKNTELCSLLLQSSALVWCCVHGKCPIKSSWSDLTFFSFVVVTHSIVMSSSLWPHGLKHARLTCPLLSSGVCSNSCPLSRWCHPTISSSAIPFFSCLQSFPTSGSFQWISSSHHVAKLLELQPQSFQWALRINFLFLLYHFTSFLQ